LARRRRRAGPARPRLKLRFPAGALALAASATARAQQRLLLLLAVRARCSVKAQAASLRLLGACSLQRRRAMDGTWDAGGERVAREGEYDAGWAARAAGGADDGVDDVWGSEALASPAQLAKPAQHASEQATEQAAQGAPQQASEQACEQGAALAPGAELRELEARAVAERLGKLGFLAGLDEAYDLERPENDAFFDEGFVEGFCLALRAGELLGAARLCSTPPLRELGLLYADVRRRTFAPEVADALASALGTTTRPGEEEVAR
jgi:hypothetical protein